MPPENELHAGLSQMTGGANGLINGPSRCIGNPNTYCLQAGVFAVGCVLQQVDSTTNYSSITWTNTGTVAVPAWTQTVPQGISTVKVSLTSAQILALNTTAIVLIAAPAIGQAIQLISVTGRINFLTAAYATNTELDIIDTTAGTKLYEDTGTLLASTSTKVAQIEPVIASNAANVITAAGSVSAKIATGNPITGAGSVDLYITYRVITL